MSARRGRRASRALLIGVLIGLVLGIMIGYEIGRLISPGEAEIEILMVYGSEKQPWIEAVLPVFEREYEERTGVSVRVVGIPMGSGESMYQMLLGQIKPVIWSPACSIWIPLANYLWAKEHGGAKLVKDGDWVPLVRSPLVIITWDDLQVKWGITGIGALHDLAVSERGDELKFAHTDPSLSNSGLMSVLMELVAATGKKPEELEVSDMADPAVKTWISELEARAVAYPSSTGWLVDKMISSGPSKINAVLAYENLVIAENMAARKRLLVAVYPEEGVLMSDHPFCILNAPWVSQREREIAIALRDFLLRADIQEEAMRSGFRPVNETVSLDTGIFSPEWGVSADIPCEVLSTEVDPMVIWMLPDLWLVCRP